MTVEEARRLVREENIEDPRYWEAKAALPALEREAARNLDAQIKAAVEATKDEWTREATIERRAAWNAAVKSGEYGTKTVNMARLIADMGFRPADLKDAIARHGL